MHLIHTHEATRRARRSRACLGNPVFEEIVRQAASERGLK
jgi:hypothetical protein